MSTSVVKSDVASVPGPVVPGAATSAPGRQPGASAHLPLSLGSVQLEAPVVQAALSGYSDWPMRVLARRYGAAYALAEVMLDRFLLDQKPERSRTRHHLLVTDAERPVGGQLMGADPVQFGLAARRLVAAGFDVVDINFGCPVKKVLGRCRGGFHLGQPGVALEIVRRVRDAVPEQIPVTVKMRRGIDGTQLAREQFFDILDGAFALGVAAITVHGRTVSQRYNGPADWGFLREVKQHAGQGTIIGSGDLFSADSCLRMLRETGVDGVSIARGAIGNPWIFRQLRTLLDGQPLPPAPTVHEQREAIEEHFDLARSVYGLDRCLPVMRKFGTKYARLHPDSEEVRNAFALVKAPLQWQAVISEYYQQDEPGCYPVVDEVAHPAVMTGAGGR